MRSLMNKVNAAVVAAAVLFTSGAAFAAEAGTVSPASGGAFDTLTGPGLESAGGGEKAPDVIRKEMSVSGYQLVKVNGKFKVYLSEGDEQKVVVEADESLMPEVKHFVTDNTLNIYTSDKVNKRITLWITLKDINNFNEFGNVRVIRE